jgi:putative hydrolase of the HAD superfamily
MNTILFDLDNTLTHRQASIRQYAWRFVLDFGPHLHTWSYERICRILITMDHGGYLPEDSLYAHIKEAIADQLLQHLSWKNAPTHETLIEHRAAHFPASAVPMPGLYTVLDALKHHSWLIGIVSNGAQTSRHRTIQGLHIEDVPDVVICSGEVGVKKPDPRIFELALRQLGVEASTTWFIGDHPVNDIMGATNAGLHAIWVKGFHEWPADLPKPEWEIESLDEISEIIGL